MTEAVRTEGRMHRGHFRRVRAMLAAGLVLGIGASTGVATWTDVEQVRAEFRADVLPAPTLTRSCEFRRSTLIPLRPARVAIYWELPEDYALADVQMRASTSGLGSVLAPLSGFTMATNTSQLADGTYLTEVPAGLLTELLGLGSELELAIVIVDGSWESERASVASNAGLVVGLGGNCRNLT